MLALLNVDGTNLLAGTYGSGVFHSSDYGASWTTMNDGLTNLNISALSRTGAVSASHGANYIFAGNIGDPSASVWRINVSEITSVREQITNEIPDDYALQQNYPNPFNPSTRIVYSVPQQSVVTIKVFDILGDEIATLVNENKETGTYELIKANAFIQTKKMILLK